MGSEHTPANHRRSITWAVCHTSYHVVCHFHPQPNHLTARVATQLLRPEGWKAELILLGDWQQMPNTQSGNSLAHNREISTAKTSILTIQKCRHHQTHIHIYRIDLFATTESMKQTWHLTQVDRGQSIRQIIITHIVITLVLYSFHFSF